MSCIRGRCSRRRPPATKGLGVGKSLAQTFPLSPFTFSLASRSRLAARPARFAATIMAKPVSSGILWNPSNARAAIPFLFLPITNHQPLNDRPPNNDDADCAVHGGVLRHIGRCQPGAVSEPDQPRPVDHAAGDRASCFPSGAYLGHRFAGRRRDRGPFRAAHDPCGRHFPDRDNAVGIRHVGQLWRRGDMASPEWRRRRSVHGIGLRRRFRTRRP